MESVRRRSECTFDVTADDKDTEARIRDLAGAFHGVVSRAQLLAAGVSSHAIEYRVRKSRLRPLYHGVYRVGPVASKREREAAALLACGPSAALSHETAAGLWHLLREPRDAPVHVAGTSLYRCTSPGVRRHRPRQMHPEDVTSLDGLLLTTPARTLMDLAASVDPRQLEQLVARAERDGLVTGIEIMATLDHSPKVTGAIRLRRLFESKSHAAFTRSEAEACFLSLIRRGGLPSPKTNVQVLGYEVDALWRAEKLIVEVDGFAFHSSREAFERDRARDSQLSAQGYRVMRVTWKQLGEQPEAVLVRIALALGRASTQSQF